MRFESCPNHCDISGEGLSLRSMPFISTMYFTLARAVSKTVLQSSAMSTFLRGKMIHSTYGEPMVPFAHGRKFRMIQPQTSLQRITCPIAEDWTIRDNVPCAHMLQRLDHCPASLCITADRYSHDDVVYNVMSECQGQRVNMCIHMHTVSYSHLCI